MTSTASAATDLMIARQPVYDPALRVVAYELLVQRRDGSSATEESDASSTISEIGLNLVVGHPAYIPLSRAAEAVIEELVAGGYRLALVDLEPGAPAERLLPFAHVVGIDIRDAD